MNGDMAGTFIRSEFCDVGSRNLTVQLGLYL